MNRRAVFLDRDGVLTELILNPATGAYESPHALSDLQMIAGSVAAALKLQEHGFALFIVSNQPSYAKGKVGLDVIQSIAAQTEEFLRLGGVKIEHAFYCYHHPKGIVPEYTCECLCRKPKPQMLLDARDLYGIDLAQSWMVGDQESDVACGKAAGCRTVLVENPLSAEKRPGVEVQTARAIDLCDAAEKILNFIFLVKKPETIST